MIDDPVASTNRMVNTAAVSNNSGGNTHTGFSDTTLRLVHLLFGATVCIVTILANQYLKVSAADLTGPLAIVDHLFNLFLTLGIAGLLLSVGYAISRAFAIDYQSPAEQNSFSFFLGVGVVGLSVLFLGLGGLLRPVPVVSVLGIYLVGSTRYAPDLYRSLIGSARNTVATRERVILTCLFACLCILLLLRAATAPHIADELIYHLPVPQQFVEQGRVFPSFDNSLGNVPFLIHMIYALCLLAGSDIAAKLISLSMAFATAALVYAFCIRYLTRSAAVVALFAFFAAGVVVELSVTVRIDISLAGVLFAATYAMINYLTTKQRAWLWMSAVLAGFSLGIKHTAGVWIAFIGLLYLVEMIRNRERIAQVVMLGVAYTFIALVIASPWYIKNTIWFHNPIYPFVTGEVASFGSGGIRYFTADDERKLESHFEAAGRERPEIVKAQEEELKKAIHARAARHPIRLWEFFTRPNAYLMAEPYQFPNYLFLFVPLVVLLKPPKWVIWLLVISLGFVFAVTLTSWIARYLLPAYPALTIVTAYVLTALSTRLRERIPLAEKLPQYAVAGGLAMIVATSIASMRYFHSPSFVAGNLSRRQFLYALPDYRPIEFINQQLPANARVMALGAQMTYGLQREYLADESWFATKWRRLLVQNDSLDRVNQQLKADGYTHILYNPTLFKFAARMGLEGTGGMNLLAQSKDTAAGARELGPEYSLLRSWCTFTVYKEKYLETLYTDDYGYQVLKIK